MGFSSVKSWWGVTFLCTAFFPMYCLAVINFKLQKSVRYTVVWHWSPSTWLKTCLRNSIIISKNFFIFENYFFKSDNSKKINQAFRASSSTLVLSKKRPLLICAANSEDQLYLSCERWNKIFKLRFTRISLPFFSSFFLFVTAIK
jgi:hypothetical protein